MGTNYYAIPKPTPKEEKEYKNLADKKDWQTLANKLRLLEKIHIGKSSAGWQFTFDHNNWEYFEQDEKAVIEFINKCKLFDEYNRSITHDEFWQMIEAKKDGLDVKAYYEKYPDHRPAFSEYRKTDDIYVGKFLFSPYTDFS